MPRAPLARRAAALSVTAPAAVAAGNIAFDSGHAFPGVLPDLTAEAERALTTYRTETLQYGPRNGMPGVRAAIASLMADDGASVSPEEILVTNGAKHAIELVCRLLLDEGDSVVVTAPTYFSAIPIIRSFGATFLDVGQDSEGMDVTALATLLGELRRAGRPLPKFIYNVPDYHNPTGISMSLARRKALVALAVEHQIVIVEDSPYRQVRFEGEPLPTLKALDRDGLVYLVGTFSKLMAPGIRVGWVAAPEEMIARMSLLKSDAGSSPLNQRIVLEFLAGGRLAAHIARVQHAYRANRDHMVAALRRELPDVSWDLPHGGYYVWLTLPAGVDGDEVARRAAAAGVTALPGSKFFARSDSSFPRNHIRIAFSHAGATDAEEGVRRLAAAYRTVVAESPAMAGSPA